MTNHYVATVPVKFTDTDVQERTRFQRLGAMFRKARDGDGSEFFVRLRRRASTWFDYPGLRFVNVL